jgi:hypothetical protein
VCVVSVVSMSVSCACLVMVLCRWWWPSLTGFSGFEGFTLCIRVLSVLCVSRCLGLVSESKNCVPPALYNFRVDSGSVLVFGSDMSLISWVVQWVSSLVITYRRCMRDRHLVHVGLAIREGRD